jgi:hypothetical protein
MIKIKNTYSCTEGDEKMKRAFECVNGFRPGGKVQESGIYDVIHNPDVIHDSRFALITKDTLYKDEDFPSCDRCNLVFHLSESKSYMD